MADRAYKTALNPGVIERALRIGLATTLSISVVAACGSPPTTAERNPLLAGGAAPETAESSKAVAGKTGARSPGIEARDQASRPGGKKELFVESNFFDLEFERVMWVRSRKQGGGLSVTNEELILVTGDGQVRVLDLDTGQRSTPAIEMPPNNEESALAAAGLLEDEARARQARNKVRDNLRYDDILVFDRGNDRNILVSYAYFEPEEGCFTHRVSLFRAPAGARLDQMAVGAEGWTELFTAQPCFGFRRIGVPFAGHQSGGRMALLDAGAGEVALALGDYAHDGLIGGLSVSQDEAADFGKILKLDVDQPGASPISIGHRNPQGISVGDDGRIWAVEHGPMGGDELNLIKPGANYGWPVVTYGINYGRNPWPFSPQQAHHPGYEKPVFAFVPSIAVSNLAVSHGVHPFWEGDLLIFTLSDHAIHRVRIEDDRAVYSERMALPTPTRIRYGLVHAGEGMIYLWTDDNLLYRLRPTKEAFELAERSVQQYKGDLSALAERDLLLMPCMECHAGGTSRPPRVSEWLGRPIGGSAYSGYSSALKAREGSWDADKLRSFLRDPQAFAPGTTMPDPGIRSEEELDLIIEAIQAHSPGTGE